MIPKIIFKYSKIYDKILRKKDIGEKRTKILSSTEIINYIKEIEKIWKHDEKKILRGLVKIVPLKWGDKKIYCYVVGSSIPFSDPLTIPAYYKLPSYFIDILIHELIHVLFAQPVNYQKMRRVWKYFYKKFKKESIITINHIPLHSFYTYIMLKFYNNKRLKREINFISYLQPYRRSWEIVLDKGHEKIIEEFRGLIT